MKKLLLPSLATALCAVLMVAPIWAQAQSRIYRCGNEYTNTVLPGQKGCKPLEGGNVTIVPRLEPTRVASAQSGEAARNRENEAQRQRDAGARQILEAELQRAQTRRAELTAEYNNGEPEKVGAEFRNHQRYLDRVEELKNNIQRNESDIAGLQRELERLSESK